MKTEFLNRNGKRIVVVVEQAKDQKGLVFVMHGLGGYKEQPTIRAFAESFIEKNFTVVTFDTAHTFGESEGEYEDATVTNYYEDLEDVIGWSSEQEWYEEPFVLVGHSLGGISTALYAEKYPEKVKALAPISTVVSGELSLETSEYEKVEEWKKSGWRIKESKSKPGRIKKLKWSHVEDRKQYDLLKDVNKLKMPVLLIVGEKDESTPVEHQKILFDAIPGQKELHVIDGAPHTFVEEEHLVEIKEIFSTWIKIYLT